MVGSISEVFAVDVLSARVRVKRWRRVNLDTFDQTIGTDRSRFTWRQCDCWFKERTIAGGAQMVPYASLIIV